MEQMTHGVTSLEPWSISQGLRARGAQTSPSGAADSLQTLTRGYLGAGENLSPYSLRVNFAIPSMPVLPSRISLNP